MGRLPPLLLSILPKMLRPKILHPKILHPKYSFILPSGMSPVNLRLPQGRDAKKLQLPIWRWWFLMNIALLEAYIANPGKYNEGQLAYARLQFPTDAETVRAVPPAQWPAPKADREERLPYGHGARSGPGIKRSAWREAMRTCWGDWRLQ